MAFFSAFPTKLPSCLELSGYAVTSFSIIAWALYVLAVGKPFKKSIQL
jgi:hypothetical protein